jgi:VanZ family protein
VHRDQSTDTGGCAKKKKSLTILSLILVFIALFFGLRPKTWPDVNAVHWLPNKEALVFKHPGFAYVDNLPTFHDSNVSDGFTIHLRVAAENLSKGGFRSLAMLHDGVDQHQLAIWQWGTSIIAMNGDDYDFSRRLPRISAENVFLPGSVSSITLTSGPAGTRLFKDGMLVREIDKLILTVPANGKKLRLVLGNSVYANHSWEGELYSLAVHGQPLSPEKIQQDYENLSHDTADDLLLLYTFEAGHGGSVEDRSGNNPPLLLPSRPLSLEKKFLVTPWYNFKLSKYLLIDVVVNIVGFIPLGMVLYSRLRLTRRIPPKFTTASTVILCLLLSLIIEILQGWLPARTSSMLDLSLNTLGAWLGVRFFIIFCQANLPYPSVQR